MAGDHCDTSPRGRGPVCRETANRVGRIQHRDYGWSGGGFARLWLRRAGGERGDFTARTKAITRLVGTPRPLNASAATNRSSETKATSVTVAIHGTQAIPTNDTTAAAPSFFPWFLLAPRCVGR